MLPVKHLSVFPHQCRPILLFFLCDLYPSAFSSHHIFIVGYPLLSTGTINLYLILFCCSSCFYLFMHHFLFILDNIFYGRYKSISMFLVGISYFLIGINLFFICRCHHEYQYGYLNIIYRSTLS